MVGRRSLICLTGIDGLASETGTASRAGGEAIVVAAKPPLTEFLASVVDLTAGEGAVTLVLLRTGFIFDGLADELEGLIGERWVTLIVVLEDEAATGLDAMGLAGITVAGGLTVLDIGGLVTVLVATGGVGFGFEATI